MGRWVIHGNVWVVRLMRFTVLSHDERILSKIARYLIAFMTYLWGFFCWLFSIYARKFWTLLNFTRSELNSAESACCSSECHRPWRSENLSTQLGISWPAELAVSSWKLFTVWKRSPRNMSYRQNEGVEVSLHSFFTSTADGSVWLAPRERARTLTVHKAVWGPKVSLEG